MVDLATNIIGEDSARAPGNLTAWLPDLIYTGDGFKSGLSLICDAAGRIVRISRDTDGITDVVRLENQALLPGMINAHSHAFQRVIRGRTEARAVGASGASDNFWAWRTAMYRAANLLSPEDIYDVSRMAFLEMALGGITSVGEFHYLHRTPEGAAYNDPNLLAKEVVRAARDVGIRIALLRTAYARSDFRTLPGEQQRRFIEPQPETFISNAEALRLSLARDYEAGVAWMGVAPHSVRALDIDYLREVFKYAGEYKLPVHIHVAEQPAEVEACIAEHGRPPAALLDYEELLNERTTCIHAIHITPEEASQLHRARAIVCSCLTAERNLGDGIMNADLLLALHRNEDGTLSTNIALGTDSQAQIDLLEDARELEYHLRLQKLERAVLSTDKLDNAPEARMKEQDSDGDLSGLARMLFACATTSGARSINSSSGSLEVGRPADFFTVDVNDVSIAGAGEEDLLTAIVFSLSRTAVRTIVVNGFPIVEDGRHRAQDEIVARFRKLQNKLWRNGK
jgi:formimidoylglutamate deiminase